jgi:glycine dehydrogenase
MSAVPFVRTHIGPSPEDIEEMVRVAGTPTLDDLITETIPEKIRLRQA